MMSLPAMFAKRLKMDKQSRLGCNEIVRHMNSSVWR